EIPTPMQNLVLLLLWQLSIGPVQIDSLMPGQLAQLIAVVTHIARQRPGLNGTLSQALVRLRNDEVEVIIQDVAEALADRTRPARVVEREEKRRRPSKGATTRSAMKLIAQAPGLISDDGDQRRPAPFDERRLE